MSQSSLNEKFASLQAERERTWAPQDLKGNQDQRRDLVADFARRRIIQAGDTVQDFTVAEVDGELLRLGALLETGPVVLVFFRFAGCPACNIALPHYAQTLYPELASFNATLVALSPQVPDKLVAIKHQHNLPFKVATDTANRLAHLFNISFEPDDATKAATVAKGKGYIGETTGTGDWFLPAPAVVVIGTDHKVKFADVSPDWLLRTEASAVLTALADATATELAQ